MATRRQQSYREESSSEESDAKYDISLEAASKRRKMKISPDANPQEGVRKRGRGPSKRPCLNRNAQMARENRQRKKEYVERIESALSHYKAENKKFQGVIQKLIIDNKRLQAESVYLKSVLKNKSSITALLQAMNQNLQRYSTTREVSEISQCNSEVTSSNLEASESMSLTGDYYHQEREAQQFAFHEKFTDVTDTYKVNGMQKLEEGKIDIKTGYPFFVMDHNYTPMLFSTEEDNVLLNHGQEDMFEGTFPITPVSMDDQHDLIAKDSNLDQLSSLNNLDILDNLSELDMPNAVDFTQESNSFLSDSFFQGLDDNAGVCLHVNSNKVSLEFCSSCHMNSQNSGIE